MDDRLEVPDSERGLYPKYRAVKIAEDGIPLRSNTPRCSKNCPAPDKWHYDNCSFYNTVITDDWNVIKINDQPIEEVESPFFLLKFDDPYAQEALYAYAEACAHQYPTLAADIKRKLLWQKLG